MVIVFGQRPRRGRCPVEHRGTFVRSFVRSFVCLFVWLFVPPPAWSFSPKFYWRHFTPIWSNLGAGDERQEPWRDWGALPDWPGVQVRRWGFCKSEVGTQKNAVQWLLFKIVVLIFIVRFQILTGSDRGKTTSLQCRLACWRRSGISLLSYRYSFCGMDYKCQNQLISIFKLW